MARSVRASFLFLRGGERGEAVAAASASFSFFFLYVDKEEDEASVLMNRLYAMAALVCAG